MKLMISYIDHNYGRSIRIGDIACAAGICVRECQRCFSESIHTTPLAFLTQKRISAAAGLLYGTNRPIIDIAASCGFPTQSYFNRKFLQYTGMTPGEYRRSSEFRNLT